MSSQPTLPPFSFNLPSPQCPLPAMHKAFTLPSIAKHVTYYHLHYLYFTFLSLLGALVLSFHSNFSFVDALFNSVSALTVTSLNTVEMHRFTLLHSITLSVLMILGSQVFTSILPLLLRRYCAHVQKKFGRSIPRSMYDEYLTSLMNVDESNSVEIMPFEQRAQSTKFSMDVQELPDNATVRVTVLEAKHELGEREKELSALFQQRNPEIEALDSLTCVVTLYFLAIQILGFVACDMYFLTSDEARKNLKKYYKNHSFFSFFLSVSAFANAGFTLTDASLMPFPKGVGLLLSLCVLILIGNTMFPPCLRCIIWLLHRFARGRKKMAYGYLLQNPRKCFTHLFSSRQTVWLVVTVVLLNASQMVCIFTLDWHSEALNGLGAGYKIVDGVFQSITTRNAGMQVMNVPSLSPPTLFLIVGMMYLAVYPVSIIRQHSQEIDAESSKSHGKEHETSIYGLCRRLLARDSVLLLIIIFLVCLTERNQIRHDPLNFSFFNILFEIISGYGTVGLSMGYSCELKRTSIASGFCKDVSYSLSGKFTPGGKLLLVLTMLLGRSRGLPQSIDSAIKLPVYKQPLEQIYSPRSRRGANTSGTATPIVSFYAAAMEDQTIQIAEGHVCLQTMVAGAEAVVPTSALMEERPAIMGLIEKDP